jgi:hypothetical protein
MITAASQKGAVVVCARVVARNPSRMPKKSTAQKKNSPIFAGDIAFTTELW